MKRSGKLPRRTALGQRSMKVLRVITQPHQLPICRLHDQTLKMGIRPVTSLLLMVRPIVAFFSAFQCHTHGAGPHL